MIWYSAGKFFLLCCVVLGYQNLFIIKSSLKRICIKPNSGTWPWPYPYWVTFRTLKIQDLTFCLRWSYIQSMNVTRSRVALVADMDRLWAIGGYDGMKNLSTVSIDWIICRFSLIVWLFRLRCTTLIQILGHLLPAWSPMKEVLAWGWSLWFSYVRGGSYL